MIAHIFLYAPKSGAFVGHVCPVVGDVCLLSGHRARWISIEHMLNYNGRPDEIIAVADVPHPWMQPIKGSDCIQTARAFARYCGLKPAWWARTPALFAKWLKGVGDDRR